MSVLIIYLLIVNFLTFIVYGLDKLKAINSWSRIPESTLIYLAIIGGSLGALLGMTIWHHKTKHKKFYYGIPAILFIHIIFHFFLNH